MTFPRQVEKVLRTLAALPEDDYQPEDYAALDAARAYAIGEVGRMDRAEARKTEASARRTPAKKAKAWKPDPPELRAAKNVVHARSGGLCEAKTDVCDHYAVHVHHIARRRGKHAHDPSNLLDLCRACHDFLHANPELSYERGWLIRSGALPPVVNTKGAEK